jgi:hypothetical protein
MSDLQQLLQQYQQPQPLHVQMNAGLQAHNSINAAILQSMGGFAGIMTQIRVLSGLDGRVWKTVQTVTPIVTMALVLPMSCPIGLAQAVVALTRATIQAVA